MTHELSPSASQNRDDNHFTVRVPHTKNGLVTFMLIGASIPYSRCLQVSASFPTVAKFLEGALCKVYAAFSLICPKKFTYGNAEYESSGPNFFASDAK